MDTAVRLRNVSKEYPIFDSSRDRLWEALDPLRRTFHRSFWALRDVSLEMPRGATVGILGVNGSGKSTLLKILSSVLLPTSGDVEVFGRVAALLELGAGFDRLLTGRANAEFHCVLNGYRPAEIRDLMPRIEAFADIGDFFNQPMQIYSSGMFMRVAFATSIHVDPDILIVDEALSVGDARFQQKCYRKFREFQDAGKTILVVTHDRFMVPRLCTNAVLLHQGRVVLTGDPAEVTERYSELLAHDGRSKGGGLQATNRLDCETDEPTVESPDPFTIATTDLQADYCCDNPTYNKNEARYGIGDARIIDYAIVADGQRNPSTFQVGATIDLWVKIAFLNAIEAPIVGFTLKTADGILVYSTNSLWLETKLLAKAASSIGEYCFSFQANLGNGDWFLSLAIARSQEHMADVRENICHFHLGHPKPSSGLVHLSTKLLESGAASGRLKIRTQDG